MDFATHTADFGAHLLAVLTLSSWFLWSLMRYCDVKDRLYAETDFE